MKTLRLNTATQEYTLHEGQYHTADGKPGLLHEPWVQLEVVETQEPQYDAALQKLVKGYSFDVLNTEPYALNGTATVVWQVVDKTPEELFVEDWLHPDYSMRLIIPKTLISAYPQLLYELTVTRKLPVEDKGDMAHVYCNEILESDQALVDSLEGMITIENKLV